jgi:hypothetical protein
MYVCIYVCIYIYIYSVHIYIATKVLQPWLQQKVCFITGQNEREETTQNTIVTKSAVCASYKSNYVTYITATYTRAKRRWHGATAHAPLQPCPPVADIVCFGL